MKNSILKIVQVLSIILILLTENLYAQHFKGSLWLNCHANYSSWKTFLADVNGDGRADIICWHAGTAQARVFTAKPESNGFNLPVTWIDDPGNYTGWQVFLADVNGDGRADIVLWSPASAVAYVMRAKQETNGFCPKEKWVDSPGNYNGWKTYLTDENGDGRADILLWNPAAAHAEVLTAKHEANAFNTAKTWVDSPGNYSGAQWNSFIGDVSGDGKADIVAWCAPHEKVVVFRSKDEADGFFNGSVWYDGPWDYGGHLHLPMLADVSGDGRADIVDWEASDERAMVWRAKEDGNGYGFYPAAQWVNGPADYSAASNAFFLADVTGDGRADLLDWSSSHAWANVWASKQIGEGYGFKPAVRWVDNHANFGPPSQSFIADVTGDKRADIVVWDAAHGKAQVWVVEY